MHRRVGFYCLRRVFNQSKMRFAHVPLYKRAINFQEKHGVFISASCQNARLSFAVGREGHLHAHPVAGGAASFKKYFLVTDASTAKMAHIAHAGASQVNAPVDCIVKTGAAAGADFDRPCYAH